MSHPADPSDPEFQYFVSDKKPVLVVTFVGDLDSSAVEGLKRCREELSRHTEYKYAILYFRDVENITGDGIPILTHLQMEMRAKAAELKLVSLKPSVKEKLLKMGVVRGTELSNNLKEALDQMLQSGNRAGTKLKAA